MPLVRLSTPGQRGGRPGSAGSTPSTPATPAASIAHAAPPRRQRRPGNTLRVHRHRQPDEARDPLGCRLDGDQGGQTGRLPDRRWAACARILVRARCQSTARPAWIPRARRPASRPPATLGPTRSRSSPTRTRRRQPTPLAPPLTTGADGDADAPTPVRQPDRRSRSRCAARCWSRSAATTASCRSPIRRAIPGSARRVDARKGRVELTSPPAGGGNAAEGAVLRRPLQGRPEGRT